MTERLRSPRKSILSRPRSSTPCISYWVTMGASSGLPPAGLALDGQVLGQRLVGDDHGGGVDAVLAPQALEPLATSMTFLASGSVSYMARSSDAAAKPSSCPSVLVRQAASGVSRPMTSGGMALAILSPTM
jgi:hypothetical protein